MYPVLCKTKKVTVLNITKLIKFTVIFSNLDHERKSAVIRS